MTEKRATEKDLGESGIFRRRMGIAGWIAGILAFVTGGFDWFNVQADQLWAVLGTSSALMGIGIAKNIWGNKTNNNNNNNGNPHRYE